MGYCNLNLALSGNFKKMKRFSLVTLAALVSILASGFFISLGGATSHKNSYVVSYETFSLDTVTIYHPLAAQCDQDPLVTASNSRINLKELNAGTLRWMALSRDMLKRWGGLFNYGDTVLLVAGDPAIDGPWVIQDTMNKRFKNRADLLFHSSSRSYGMWTGVKIMKKKVYSYSDEERADS
jgi:hypothetical protein